ncbi:histone acetyltransferase type B catalytic subunit [Apium graveolens]|uniref:histone acetyltransferase type B catalytic subunit n=1 Tax=Apium graveolens TaxID=4045 RepID=UPI003D7BC5AD
MSTKNPNSSDLVSEPKKRRRVGIAKIDAGVDPADCIKIYLVSSKEEVDAPDSFCIESVDFERFFEEDGKIYGYQGLKVTIWVSTISFHAYADISFESKSDGGKGITDLKASLQNIFAETLLDDKDNFLKTFSTERDIVNSMVSNAKILEHKAPNGHSSDSKSNLKSDPSNLEVVRVEDTSVGEVYVRLVPLAMLLVDGSSPIDITDPRWELYLLIQKKVNDQEDIQHKLIGFAALYRFYHYPGSERLRLSQILVLPPFQRKGYGRLLLEGLNVVAVSDNAYDLTIEEPLDSLQHVRTCIDVQRLLAFDPIKDALASVVSSLKQENLSKRSQTVRFGPPLDVIEEVRKNLKITKKQFLQCWEVLIYLGLDPIGKYMENYRTIILDHIKATVIGKDAGDAGKQVVDVPTEFDQELSFVMFKSPNAESTITVREDDQNNQEEQLQQLVNERIKEVELIAKRVLPHHP